MKKCLVILLLIFLMMPQLAEASTGLIKPGSKLYFLQKWGEALHLFFTFSKPSKVDYLLDLSQRRIEEIKDNPELKNEMVAEISQRYSRHFKQLEKLGQNVRDQEQAVKKIKEAYLEQQQTLSQIYQQANQQGQESILTAQNNSAQNIVGLITKVEGQEAAMAFTEQIQQIQQVQLMPQAPILPLEGGGPAADPSQTQFKNLQPLMPGQPGQELYPLNPSQNINTNQPGNSQQVQPVVPAPIIPQN